MVLCSRFCDCRKYPYQLQERLLEILRQWGFQKPKYEAKLGFLEEWGGSHHQRDMDVSKNKMFAGTMVKRLC